MRAPIPVNEAERLRALERYGVMNARAEAGLDDLCALAATVCHCPIALIGLVDATREAFIAHYGHADLAPIARGSALGAHAMLQPGIWEVPDATLDERFREHPLTVGAVQLRFYAATPLLDPDGNPLGVLCVIDRESRELTAEQRRSLVRLGAQVVAQLELRCARDRAQTALREVTEKHAALEVLHQELRALSYIISHDLRAPLINLLGFTGELRRHVGTVAQGVAAAPPGSLDAGIAPLLEDEIPRAMDFVAGAATRMSSQLDVVLKLFRMGRYALKPEAVSLAHIFHSVVQTHVRPDERACVTIALAELPEIELDSEAVYILANNLVSNALKFRHANRPCRVQVNAARDERGVTICVADNGRGIAAEDHEEIFKLFRRCGRQDTPGEGVGLTFCRTLLNRLGGRMWLESEPGEGSRFFVFLPVGRARRTARRAAARSAAA